MIKSAGNDPIRASDSKSVRHLRSQSVNILYAKLYGFAYGLNK